MVGTAPWKPTQTPKTTEETKNNVVHKVLESQKVLNHLRISIASFMIPSLIVSVSRKYDQIVDNLRNQLTNTVTGINEMFPNFSLTIWTKSEDITQIINVVTENKTFGKRTELCVVMLRSILAIRSFREIWSKFHDNKQWSSISTTVEMIKQAIKYIRNITGDTDKKFDGSIFFLRVPLVMRSDAITALLVCSECCRVESSHLGVHRFVVVCKRDVKLIDATMKFIKNF